MPRRTFPGCIRGLSKQKTHPSMCPAGLQVVRKALCGGTGNAFPALAAAMLFYRKRTSMLFFISQQLLSNRITLRNSHPYLNILNQMKQPYCAKNLHRLTASRTSRSRPLMPRQTSGWRQIIMQRKAVTGAGQHALLLQLAQFVGHGAPVHAQVISKLLAIEGYGKLKASRLPCLA